MSLEVATLSKAKAKPHRLPENWSVSGELMGWSVDEVMRLTGRDAVKARDFVNGEEDKFIDYWKAAATKTAVKLDWSAAWRNWLRMSIERNQATPTVTTSRVTPRAALARSILDGGK